MFSFIKNKNMNTTFTSRWANWVLKEVRSTSVVKVVMLWFNYNVKVIKITFDIIGIYSFNYKIRIMIISTIHLWLHLTSAFFLTTLHWSHLLKLNIELTEEDNIGRDVSIVLEVIKHRKGDQTVAQPMMMAKKAFANGCRCLMRSSFGR